MKNLEGKIAIVTPLEKHSADTIQLPVHLQAIEAIIFVVPHSSYIMLNGIFLRESLVVHSKIVLDENTAESINLSIDLLHSHST